jgi:hypothetical protein
MGDVEFNEDFQDDAYVRNRNRRASSRSFLLNIVMRLGARTEKQAKIVLAVIAVIAFGIMFLNLRSLFGGGNALPQDVQIQTPPPGLEDSYKL